MNNHDNHNEQPDPEEAAEFCCECGATSYEYQLNYHHTDGLLCEMCWPGGVPFSYGDRIEN